MPNLKLARDILYKAQRQGAQAAEVWLEQTQATTIEVKEQRVDTFKLAEGGGIALRVIKNQQSGFAFSSDRSETALNQLVSNALAAAQSSSHDQYHSLPEPLSTYPLVPGKDAQLGQVKVREKIERARELERTAQSYDKRIDKVRQASYQDTQYEVLILNSRGVELSYDGSLCSLSLMAVATENGESQSGWDIDLSRCYQGLASAKNIGEAAAQRAISLLGAQTLSTRQTAIIFDNQAAAELLGMFSSAFSAEAVQKGKSLLAGKEGQRIASPAVSIIDDGLLKEGLHCAPADGEGVPMQTTPLIQDGALAGFLHNSYTAAKANTTSTGNGMRAGFKSPPGVGISNFFLQPGKVSFEQLLADTKQGLYVTQIMGAHTCNPISGDFSVGVMGRWIEKGELRQPVRGMTIAGNLLELLQRVDLVADNLRFLGSVGTPSFRCQDIMLGGE